MEGVLYVEVHGTWEQTWAEVGLDQSGGPPLLKVCERLRSELPATKANSAQVIAQLTLLPGQVEVKVSSVSLATMSKLLKTKAVPATPVFFSVKVYEDAGDSSATTYRFCCASDEQRRQWMDTLKRLVKVKSSGVTARARHVTSGANFPALISARPGQPLMSSPPKMSSSERERLRAAKAARREGAELYEHEAHPDDVLASGGGEAGGKVTAAAPEEDEGDEEGDSPVCGILKVSTAWRFFQCLSAFPFAIVLQALKAPQFKSLLFLTRSLVFIRTMNGALFFGIPIVFVDVVLQRFSSSSWVQRLTIGLYCLALLVPVLYIVASKLSAANSPSGLEDGTFSFKPSRRVRWTVANAIQLGGFVLEWLLTCTMVLPSGVLGIFPSQTIISAVPPYLPFSVYFWTAFTLAMFCALVIVLNSSLRGRWLYHFRRSRGVWYLFNWVGGPGVFMVVLTILFMALQCSYSSASSAPPLTLQGDPTMACYSNRHIMLARAGLVAVGVYFVQLAMLPAATFKESLSEALDIVFVPVYHSLHRATNLAFCFFFVFLYQDETPRIVALSLVNLAALCTNLVMQPCSVAWVNTLRDCMLLHACLSSVHSLNLVAWYNTHAANVLMLSTLVSTAIFSAVLVGAHLLYHRNTEFVIAKSFLEIEYAVSTGVVSPRALEQLIALTASPDKADWSVAKKYAGQVVWLLNYPNLRVQFQAAWALANVALLDEESRIKIHEAGGTAALLDKYDTMAPMAQLESLAALANLTLSPRIADELALKGNCIPFFMSFVARRSGGPMHCVFACIALGNLARKEVFRDVVRRSGGMELLASCIMSQNYQKRKYGMFVLANMALSPSREVEAVFQKTPGLLDRIIKMATRRELDTQREVVVLIRNLAAHSRLRADLLDRGIMVAIAAFRTSVYQDVARWAEEISLLMEQELATVGAATRSSSAAMDEAEAAAADSLALRKLEPMDGRVDWATWGSKLELLFDSMFSKAPRPIDLFLSTAVNEPVLVALPTSLTKKTVRMWRDAMSFVITRPPAHGSLKEGRPGTHVWTYGPNQGFAGKDSFTFRVVLGAAMSPSATCNILVEQGFDFDDLHSKASGGSLADGDFFEFTSPAAESSYFDLDSASEGDEEKGSIV